MSNNITKTIQDKQPEYRHIQKCKFGFPPPGSATGHIRENLFFGFRGS